MCLSFMKSLLVLLMVLSVVSFVGLITAEVLGIVGLTLFLATAVPFVLCFIIYLAI